MALQPNEQPDSSVHKFESMLKTDDVYFFDAEDFEDIIHHYLNTGKISLGKKAIQIGLQQHPNAIELKLLNVEVLVFEDDFDSAEKILNQLQEIDATNEEIYIQRANILSKKDDHQGAINMLLEALYIADNSFDIYSLLGMEYLFLDDFENAKKNFIKCIEVDEKDYSSLYNIIYCFEFLEDFDGGISYLNDYLERNPYSEIAWHQLGKLYTAKEMDKEALTAFDFAIISDDSFLGAYFEKGKVLEKLGKYNEAIESYQTTIDKDDPTAHAYLRIGKCHEKLGNDDLAKYYYYNTVHEDPSLDKGWTAITEFYYRKENYKKALKYINKAINIDRENATYWQKSAQIYTALENYDEADYAFKQAVDLGNYEIKTWLDWATVLEKTSDFHSALEVLLQGHKFYADSAEFHFRLAGVYLKLDKIEKAKEKFIAALKLNIEKINFFEQKYPEYAQLTWVKDVFKVHKKAST